MKLRRTVQNNSRRLRIVLTFPPLHNSLQIINEGQALWFNGVSHNLGHWHPYWSACCKSDRFICDAVCTTVPGKQLEFLRPLHGVQIELLAPSFSLTWPCCWGHLGSESEDEAPFWLALSAMVPFK